MRNHLPHFSSFDTVALYSTWGWSSWKTNQQCQIRHNGNRMDNSSRDYIVYRGKGKVMDTQMGQKRMRMDTQMEMVQSGHRLGQNTHTHTHMLPYKHACKCTHMRIHTHTHTQICVQVRTHTHTHAHTHTHTHMHTHTHAHTHTHTQWSHEGMITLYLANV